MKASGIKIDPKELLAIKKKIDSMGDVAKKDFDKELKDAAIRTRDAAKRDFSSSSAPYLESRGQDTSGLSSLITFRTLKRKSGSSAYQVSSGNSRNKIMAYIEFGTRSKRINLEGIKKIAGGEGVAYAKRFKGSDNPKNWTSLSSRPYFYFNAYKEQKRLMKRLRSLVKRKLKN